MADPGSLALRTDNGLVYVKNGLADTAWVLLGNLTAILASITFSGSASDLVAGTVPPARLPGLIGDVVQPPGSNLTMIADDAVTGAKLRNSAGTSVIGRLSANAGDPEDIVASEDGQVLRRASETLSFGTLPADIYSGTITNITLDGPVSNWNPFGADPDVTIVRVTNVSGTVLSINGIAGGTPARRVLIFNVGGPDINFITNSGAGGNIIFAPASTPQILLAAGSGRIFWYDATDAVRGWRLTERL